MFYLITDLHKNKIKNKSAQYEILQHFPDQNRIVVFYSNNLNEFANKLKEDEMGLAAFNRARRLAAEKKEVESNDNGSKPLNKMNKNELLAAAAELKLLSANAEMTKKELVALIEASTQH